MKHIVLTMLLLYLGFFQTIKSQTLHAIVFANTECPGEKPGSLGIGPSVTCDYQRMKIEFETMASFLGYKKDFQWYQGSSDQFCRKKIELALNNLSCGKDDIVFFYYSGHGGRSPQDKEDAFPWMQLVVDPYRTQWNADDYYPLSEVLKRLYSKQPRLTIVLGDLCNSLSNAIPSKDVPAMKGPTKISKAPCDFYRDLFLNVKGFIIASSSKPGETSAACTEGGAFTIAFTKALQIMVSEQMNADWETLLKYTCYLTQESMSGKQHPIYSVDLRKVTDIPDTPNPITAQQPSDEPNSDCGIEDYLTTLGNSVTPIKERIVLVSQTLNKFFANPQAKVEVVGKDGKTIVCTKYASTYLNNLSIARNLVKVVAVDHTSASNGKYTYLKVHEMYK
mgnify:FL=1